jgi:hypothetical protein
MTAFLTYLWHYMSARLLYDELARRHLLVLLVVVAGIVLVLGRRRRR